MPPTQPKTILVVDDEFHIRDILALLLRQAGLQVVTAGNGREALDYLRGNPPPDLIVLDLLMPVMCGQQFRNEQKQDPALAAIPVVVSSATPGEYPDALDGVEFCPKVPLEALARFVLDRCR